MSSCSHSAEHLEELQDCLDSVDAWLEAVQINTLNRDCVFSVYERETSIVNAVTTIPFYRRTSQERKELHDAKGMVKHLRYRIAETHQQDTLMTKMFIQILQDMPPDMQAVSPVITTHLSIAEAQTAALILQTTLQQMLDELVHRPVEEFAQHLQSATTRDLHELLQEPRSIPNSQ